MKFGGAKKDPPAMIARRVYIVHDGAGPTSFGYARSG